MNLDYFFLTEKKVSKFGKSSLELSKLTYQAEVSLNLNKALLGFSLLNNASIMNKINDYQPTGHKKPISRRVLACSDIPTLPI